MTDLERAIKSVVSSLETLIRSAIREELLAMRHTVASHTPMPQQRQWLDEEAVALQLGVPRSTVQSWRYHGLGPAFTKFGRLVRYRVDALESWTADPQAKLRRTQRQPR